MQVNIISATQHLDGVSVEIAEVILVLERPRRDFRTRGLAPHVLKVLLADSAIERAESDVLILAHHVSYRQFQNQ